MISIHIMRMRRICHRPLEVLLEAVGAERERDIQNAVTPNPTLLNPEFAAVDGWNLTGDVTLGGGAAVLRESARNFGVRPYNLHWSTICT